MNDSNQLREQIWDLIYGLVTDEERQALVERIKSDPQAARMYAEARLEADLVSEASRVEEPALAMQTPGVKVNLARRSESAGRPDAMKRPARAPSDAGRVSARLLGIAATALIALLAAGWFWPQPDARAIASRFVCTAVEAPRAMSAGLTNNLVVRTAMVGGPGKYGDATLANVSLKLRGPAGNELLNQQMATTSEGVATFSVPGGVLEPGVVLEVASNAISSTSAASAVRDMEEGAEGRAPVSDDSLFVALPVQEEPQVAYFLLEKPLADASQPTRYASWNFGSFSGKPAGADTTQIVTEGLAEVTTGAPTPSNGPDYNVLNGTLSAPSPTPERESLAFQVQNKLSEATRQRSQMRRQDPQATIAGAPAAPAGMPENLARSERAAATKPATGKQLAQQVEQLPTSNAAAAPAERTGGSAMQRGAQDLKLARGTAGQSAGYAASQAANIPAGQALDFEIPDELENRSLLLAAICRGVTVASAPLPATAEPASGVEKNQQLKSRNIKGALELPPEVDGLIDVVLVDPSSDPPQLVQQSVVYRQPAKNLSIALDSLKDRFAPREHVRLSLQVTDEGGAPVSEALVGVRLWNEAAVQSAAELPSLLTDAVRGAAGAAMMPPQADDAALAKQLSDESRNAGRSLATRQRFDFRKDVDRAIQRTPQDYREATPRSEELSDMQEVANAGDKIELASNRAAVTAEYEAALTAAQRSRQAIVERIARVVIVGSVLILLLAVLELARRRAGVFHMAGPALVVGLASLFAGVSWIGWLPQHGEKQIAMTPLSEETASRGDAQRANEWFQSPAPSQAPAAAAAMPASPSNLGIDALSAKKETLTADKPAVLSGERGATAAGGIAAGGGGDFGAKVADGAVRLKDEAEAKSKAAEQPPAGAVATVPPQAPPSLYFNPQLLTDGSGRVTIEFVMPPVDAEYRLLIDALGKGRIGSHQQVITCRAN